MRRLTIEDFIFKSNKKHNYEYNYDDAIYINNYTKVIIKCKKHGAFEQSAAGHMRGQGCPKCKGGIKYDLEDFIKKGNEVHNMYYDYSKSIYIDNQSKINIICPEHGLFKQLSNNHLSGQGCPKCVGKFITNNEFIDKCTKAHNGKYSYIKTIYKGSEVKITIICTEHGEFEQKASNHLNLKYGCAKCAGVAKSNTIDFIEKSIKIHGDLYDYKNVFYRNAKNDVEIICKKHGSFLQQPTKHLSSQGCPVCKLSKGELKIFKILSENNINFKTHHRFNDLNLIFDFFLPDENIAIEYDGIQHFEPINHFGGFKSFENQKIRDKEKDEYCIKNNIHLLRIPYYKDEYELLSNTINF